MRIMKTPKSKIHPVSKELYDYAKKNNLSIFKFGVTYDLIGFGKGVKGKYLECYCTGTEKDGPCKEFIEFWKIHKQRLTDITDDTFYFNN